MADNQEKKLPPLLAGVYRHYKGPLYQVLMYTHDADYEGRVCVVYIGLEFDGAKPGPRGANRTAEFFQQNVCANSECREEGYAIRDGLCCPCCGEQSVPRFEYVGPTP